MPGSSLGCVPAAASSPAADGDLIDDDDARVAAARDAAAAWHQVVVLKGARTVDRGAGRRGRGRAVREPGPRHRRDRRRAGRHDRRAPGPGPGTVRRGAARRVSCTAPPAISAASGSATPACSRRTCRTASRSAAGAWPALRSGGREPSASGSAHASAWPQPRRHPRPGRRRAARTRPATLETRRGHAPRRRTGPNADGWPMAPGVPCRVWPGRSADAHRAMRGWHAPWHASNSGTATSASSRSTRSSTPRTSHSGWRPASAARSSAPGVTRSSSPPFARRRSRSASRS